MLPPSPDPGRTPLRPHRTVTYVLMMLLSVVLIGAMTWYGIQTFSRGSLLALAVVLVGAAIAGIAFSWKRYFPGRR